MSSAVAGREVRVGRLSLWLGSLPTIVLAIGVGCGSDESEPWSATGGSGGSGLTGTGGSSSGTGGSSSGAGGSAGLPEGNHGIAAEFPNDDGIEAHPAVLFADDFEGYGQPADLDQRWDAVYHYAQIRIATESANVYGGSQALEFTVPQQDAELSNTVAKVLSQEQDVLFLRYHSKFADTFDVTGSSHNGGGISAHYYINGQATPGVPADGANKFLASYENWRGESATQNPGNLNIYVYHPEQRSDYGDHFFPTGIVLPNSSLPHSFGPDFVARPDIIPELGQWYSYEVIVQANTPGLRDGRMACWLDGVLIADFTNLRLRDVDTLTIDRLSLSLHIGSNTAAETKKWYDNVVAATAYIGPVVAN
jgi:hypothetical protein